MFRVQHQFEQWMRWRQSNRRNAAIGILSVVIADAQEMYIEKLRQKRLYPITMRDNNDIAFINAILLYLFRQRRYNNNQNDDN